MHSNSKTFSMSSFSPQKYLAEKVHESQRQNVVHLSTQGYNFEEIPSANVFQFDINDYI